MSMVHDKDKIERLLITGVGAKSSMRRALTQYADYMLFQYQEQLAVQAQRIAELEAALAVSHDAAYADVAEVIGRPIKSLDFYQPHPLLADKEAS